MGKLIFSHAGSSGNMIRNHVSSHIPCSILPKEHLAHSEQFKRAYTPPQPSVHPDTSLVHQGGWEVINREGMGAGAADGNG
ncbi:hypothetical protein DWX41_11680 [Hungatella hathewayi]|uniref:Uncharacterized protein n=1 Tax=Hungatella hathewayi TaxID=154046 RepID=A0A3E2WX68_9FIRM|nr:hypothetical protein DWX41_11680 [Hungatella hathewayi]